MGGAAILVAWLLLAVWATMFVMKQNVSGTALRLFIYAIIWLVPFVGAAVAILVTALGANRIESSSEEKMFQAVVEKRAQQPTDATDD